MNTTQSSDEFDKYLRLYPPFFFTKVVHVRMILRIARKSLYLTTKIYTSGH